MPFECVKVVGAEGDVPVLHRIDHLAGAEADIHVLFGDVHLYRSIGDEGDIARIALVPATVASPVGDRLHVEDVAIEFIHRRDVCGGKIDVMQLELHDVALRSAVTSSRAAFSRYCTSDAVITNWAPSLTSSATCSTSARMPPTPSTFLCALQALAVLS